MAVFFLVVASLNFALGYFLALYLHQDSQSATLVAASSGADWPANETEPAPTPIAALTPQVPPAAEPTLAATAPDPTPAPVAAQAISPNAPAPVEAQFDSPSAPASEAPKAAPAHDPAVVGRSISEFKNQLSRYRDRLSSLDTRMRDSAKAQDPAAIQTCLADLRGANAQHLEQQAEAKSRFEAQCASPELAPIQTQLGAALDQHSAQVQSSERRLGDIDQEENLLARCQQMLDETSQLVDANHKVRNTLEDVELQLASQTPDSGDSQLNSLISRNQLDESLSDWWSRNPARERPLSLGIVDLDHFRDLNTAHGLTTGDRILRAILHLIDRGVADNQRAVQLSAQRFLLIFPDVPSSQASKSLEKIRQRVETTRFQLDDEEISVTVSCAVVEATPADTQSTLVSRAESTLQEAKRYGRNRTFLHDGQFPAPVVPPVLSLEPRTVTV